MNLITASSLILNMQYSQKIINYYLLIAITCYEITLPRDETLLHVKSMKIT